jgi:SAM-dependent methyltransferase
MTPQIEHWVETIARPFIAHPGRVLEIGARDVNGTIRQFFADATEYIGTDMQADRGVDRVLDNGLLLLTYGLDSFDTIIACEVLEHDIDALTTVRQMWAMLRPGGHLIITTPTFGCCGQDNRA